MNREAKRDYQRKYMRKVRAKRRAQVDRLGWLDEQLANLPKSEPIVIAPKSARVVRITKIPMGKRTRAPHKIDKYGKLR